MRLTLVILLVVGLLLLGCTVPDRSRNETSDDEGVDFGSIFEERLFNVTVITIEPSGSCKDCTSLLVDIQNLDSESKTYSFDGISIVTKDGRQFSKKTGINCFYGGHDYNTLWGDQLFPNAKKRYRFCFPTTNLTAADEPILYVRLEYDKEYQGITQIDSKTKEYSIDITSFFENDTIEDEE